MSIQKLNLRKLLQLFYLPENKLTTELRKDIRSEIAKNSGEKTGGGDFHTPFWTDAKNHVAGKVDLSEATDIRIANNKGRARLYPHLMSGFLKWWNEKRRWANEEFKFMSINVKGHYSAPGINSTVKVENLLSLNVGDDSKRLIYPYFSEEPSLSEEAARIGLWLMSETFTDFTIDDMRILDVLRGRSFSTIESPLNGNEESIFSAKYDHLLKRWLKLKEEYN